MLRNTKRIYGKDDQSKVIFAYLNTSLFAMNLMMLFKSYGMDTHPMRGMDSNGIHKEFNLSPSEEVVMLLSVGYFDRSKALSVRKYRKQFNDMTTIL